MIRCIKHGEGVKGKNKAMDRCEENDNLIFFKNDWVYVDNSS